MSIYVKNDIKAEDIKIIQTKLENLLTVKRVNYISPENARKDFAEQNSSSKETLSALSEATNQFPGTFRVNLNEVNNIGELRQFVETEPVLRNSLDPKREPSFAGERRSAIDNIGRWVKFAEQAGLVASVVFIAMSSLIVFNTIRMAIFNRKDEIQMMKLIGADQSFIRGPFVVEAVVYGIIAALLATALGVTLLYVSSETLLSYGIGVKTTTDFVSQYLGLVLLGMILIGTVIGVISSLLATRRYLRL